jgi:hypothetical protein
VPSSNDYPSHGNTLDQPGNASPPQAVSAGGGRSEAHAGKTGTRKPARRFATWLRRVGVLGFAFFFFKGLLWLIIPYAVARGIFSAASSSAG